MSQGCPVENFGLRLLGKGMIAVVSEPDSFGLDTLGPPMTFQKQKGWAHGRLALCYAAEYAEILCRFEEAAVL